LTNKKTIPLHIQEEIASVISEFAIPERFVSASAITAGHINDSYLVSTDLRQQKYILQRINHSVFRDIPGLMKNIELVTRHIAEKILLRKAGAFTVPALIPTRTGGLWHQSTDGNYWRLFSYINGSRTFDLIRDPRLAREGGRAFGIFQYLLSDIPPPQLTETIPHFHTIEKRLRTFHEKIKEDPVKRLREIEHEVDFIEERAAEMHLISNLGIEGKIPLRVTHNDTKFNNILFDRYNRAICVVDLDTVMPGFVLYDFGDAIRTGANTAAEDERDPAKTSINLALFEAYAEGYLGVSQRFLNDYEMEYLAFSAKFMTYIIGLRFLTDYLDGDHYYKIRFEKHNLQRARSQFALLGNMEKNFSRMKAILDEILKEHGVKPV
jgi:Ser/Thr protein kinase RdoA (MazF antagonist)